jgi:hypothetical protein
MNNWNNFEQKFEKIITDNYDYNILLNRILLSQNNTLLFSPIGFPIDLLVDLIIKKKFNLQNKIYRTEHVWEKNLIYNENNCFLELDIMNPENSKNIDKITLFILHIIKNKNIGSNKHFIIIKNIDLLSKLFYDFRILLEKYSHNITFMCTSHYMSKIDLPIKSRFNSFRIPLFTFDEINYIFVNYLNISMNDEFAITKSRNIIKALFIAEIECSPNKDEILTDDFIKYNYPPFVDFIKTFDKNNMEEIRYISNKCCQYNVTINNIVEDFINLVDYGDYYLKIKYSKLPKKKLEEIKKYEKMKIINIGMEADYILSQTNKSKEPIHIEMVLYKLLF